MVYVLLVIGLILLVKGADWFVNGSSAIARFFHIPSFIIGLTIIAFGTSAPEAAVSITAALKGPNDIALGNVIGSNMFNLLAVTGVCAIIKPISVKTSILVKEVPFSILSTIVLLFMGADIFLDGQTANMLSRSEGWVLLLLFCVFVFMLVMSALSARKSGGEQIVAQSMDKILSEEKRRPLWQSALIVIIGLAGVIGGGQLVVHAAREIALSFGISESFVGLTVVAIGTSLPEFVTGIVAAAKGESDMAVGNVVGSNIFNILFVLAASAAIRPIQFDINVFIDLGILVGVSLLIYLFAIMRKEINRVEGGILTILYVGYMTFLVLRT